MKTERPIVFLKAVDRHDSHTVDLFGTHVETRTRKDGVTQQYHVSAPKPAPRSRQFLHDLHQVTGANPFDSRERVTDAAGVQVSTSGDDAVHLHSIRSFEAGKGHGTAALRMLTGLADKHGVRIEGAAVPFGKKGLNKKALAEWYKRHGFTVKNEEMVRHPQKPQQDYSNTSNIDPVINEQGGKVDAESCTITLGALEQVGPKRVQWFKNAVTEMNQALEAGSIIKARYAEVRSQLESAFDVAFSKTVKALYLSGPYEERPEWFQDAYYASSGLTGIKKIAKTVQPHAGHPLADASLALLREWEPIVAKVDELKDKVTTVIVQRTEKKAAEAKARALVPRTKLSEVVQAAVHAYKPKLVELYADHVTKLYNRMVEDLGPELSRAGDSSWARTYSETIRPVLGAGRKLDAARVATKANEYAEAVAEMMQGKIMSKAGQLDNPEVKALDGGRFHLAGEIGGKPVRIQQNIILNWSKYGTPFNQFPARITVDGKSMSEAEFKKLQLAGAKPLVKAVVFLPA